MFHYLFQLDVFATYKDYIRNFNMALKTIRKLNKTNERFRATLNQCQREAGEDKISLANQLLSPVQMIPKYVAFIKVST